MAGTRVRRARAAVRGVGAALILVAAVGVWSELAPEVPVVPVPVARESVGDRSGEIRAAMSDNASNEIMADSAPQQSVVNGWIARDLLQIIAEQQNEALTRPEIAPPAQLALPPNDERTPAMIGLALLAILLGIVTTPLGQARTSVTPGDPTVPPQSRSGWAPVPGVDMPPPAMS